LVVCYILLGNITMKSDPQKSSRFIIEKVLIGLICLLPFLCLFIVTKTYFSNVYLLEWMLRNKYIYIWLIAVVVSVFDPKWGIAISYGDILCIIYGELKGNWIREKNMLLATPDMDAEQLYHLYFHPGFYIWLHAFISLLLLFAVVRILLLINRKINRSNHMKKALFVGLTKYPGCELRFCDNDATSMKDLLEVNGKGEPNFDCKIIIDKCSKAELMQSIDDLFSGKGDVALLYFSGHGTDYNGGYLVTTDAKAHDYGVSMSEVMRMANASKITNRVIILDCCFSGKFGQSGTTSSTESQLEEGVTIMTASQNDEYALENTDAEHGEFTNLLLQGLKGGAADISGRITPAGLYSYVDQSLGPWEQRPVFKTNISTFLPLREIEPRVPRETLRKLSKYFDSPTMLFPLDPSYEDTNNPEIEHKCIKPYSNEKNVLVFKELQMYASVGLVEPVDTDYMYFAAMESKSCKLTALGAHYWKLSKDRRF